MTPLRQTALVATIATLLGCPGQEPTCDGIACPEGTTCSPETGACVLECDTACAAHEFCSNRECRPRYQSLQVVKPRAEGGVGATAQVEALLNVAAGATRADPATLQVDIRGPDDAGVASGPLTKVDAGLYAGSFPLTTNNGDVVAVTASYPAANLTSPKVYATTDFEPPTFLLKWTAPVRNNGTVGEHADERDSALAGAFKRDEQVRVVVTSDHVIDPGSVFLKVTGVTDAGTPGREEELIAVQPGALCETPYCGEVVVDAWKPQFDLVRGKVFAEVSGKDEAGNIGKADAGIPVTRVRWVFDYGSSFHFRAAPSVGRTGNIYVASSESLNNETGFVAAVTSEGVKLWRNDLGSVRASMPVGEFDGGERVFVAVEQPGTCTIARIIVADGGSLGLSGPGTGSCEGALALSETQATGEQGPVETLYAVLNNGASSQVQVFRPEGKSGSRSTQIDINEGLNYPGAVVTSGFQAHFVGSLGNFSSYALSSEGIPMTERFVQPVGLASTGAALTDSTFVMGGSAGPGVGAVFGARVTDGGTEWRTSNIVNQASSPVVAADGVVFAGTNVGLARVAPAAPVAPFVEATFGEKVMASPVLVSGQQLYSAGMTGKLGLWTRNLTPVWVSPVGAAFEASPNMDCARDGGAIVPGRPPTLYLLDKGGKLYSVVSDLALDTSAAWPRYQRDPLNRGTTTADLTEFACP